MNMVKAFSCFEGSAADNNIYLVTRFLVGNSLNGWTPLRLWRRNEPRRCSDWKQELSPRSGILRRSCWISWTRTFKNEGLRLTKSLQPSPRPKRPWGPLQQVQQPTRIDQRRPRAALGMSNEECDPGRLPGLRKVSVQGGDADQGHVRYVDMVLTYYR